MERKENGEYAISLGPVGLCVLLVPSMWKWAQATPETPVDLPPGMKETLIVAVVAMVAVFSAAVKGASLLR